LDINDQRENVDQKTALHDYVLPDGVEDNGWSAIWAQNFGLFVPVAPNGHTVMGISKCGAGWAEAK
jgi:hypothetical protein